MGVLSSMTIHRRPAPVANGLTLDGRVRIFVVLFAVASVMLSTLPTASADTLDNFGPENEGSGSVTRTVALRHARAFHVITARPLTYEGHVGAMMRERPKLLVTAYVSGTFLPVPKAGGVPEGQFLHDAQGNRIRSRLWGNYLMNPGNSGWARSRVEQCRYHLRISRYRGCFIDMLGTEPLTFDYLTSVPINPATGFVWTRSEWLRATKSIAARVKRAIAPKRIVVNGLGSGWRYFDPQGPTRRLFSVAGIAMAEEFVRAARAQLHLHRTERMWRQDVKMLIHADRNGKRVLAFTKVWLDTTRAVLDRWHQFALATFLLGNNGRSNFAFSSGPGFVKPHPWWRIKLGRPDGSFFKRNGVYRRRFTDGLVLVNPTATTRVVRFRRRLVDIRGNLIRSVTLVPYSGAILRIP